MADTQQSQQSIYPVIEGFVEKATPDQVEHLFDPVKDALKGLKGPKADQAKKVQAAISRTEELLSHLMQIREKLEAERKGAGKGRK